MYEVVDSQEPGAVVGVRRKDDLTGRIFTPEDYQKLQNPNIKGLGVMNSKGAVQKN